MEQRAKGAIFIGIGVVLVGCGIATAQAAAPTSSAGSGNYTATTAATRVVSTTTFVAVSSSTTVYTSVSRPQSSTSTRPSTTTALITGAAGLPAGWYVRLGSSQPDVPREVSDITELLERVRIQHPTAAVYSSDNLQGRSGMRAGYLVLLIGPYPDRTSAATTCAQLSSSLKPYGCEIDQLR